MKSIILDIVKKAMVRFVESQKENVCENCLKPEHSCTNEIVKNKQYDEIHLDSKISKVFDKNILEKSIKITILIIVEGYVSCTENF